MIEPRVAYDKQTLLLGRCAGCDSARVLTMARAKREYPRPLCQRCGMPLLLKQTTVNDLLDKPGVDLSKLTV